MRTSEFRTVSLDGITVARTLAKNSMKDFIDLVTESVCQKIERVNGKPLSADARKAIAGLPPNIIGELLLGSQPADATSPDATSPYVETPKPAAPAPIDLQARIRQAAKTTTGSISPLPTRKVGESAPPPIDLQARIRQTREGQ